MRLIFFIMMFFVPLHSTMAFEDPNSKTLFVGGSTAVSGLFLNVKDEYEKRTQYRFQLRQLGSEKGIMAVHKGVVDIGFSSRYLTREEQHKYPSLRQHIIAHDAVVLFVNKQNSVDTLTSQQVSALYSGKQRYWALSRYSHTTEKNHTHEQGFRAWHSGYLQ